MAWWYIIIIIYLKKIYEYWILCMYVTLTRPLVLAEILLLLEDAIRHTAQHPCFHSSIPSSSLGCAFQENITCAHALSTLMISILEHVFINMSTTILSLSEAVSDTLRPNFPPPIRSLQNIHGFRLNSHWKGSFVDHQKTQQPCQRHDTSAI